MNLLSPEIALRLIEIDAKDETTEDDNYFLEYLEKLIKAGRQTENHNIIVTDGQGWVVDYKRELA
jgi:hypothetical protein